MSRVRLMRINITKPIRMHPIMKMSTRSQSPKRCCLCHELILPGQLYHLANKRQGHVSCPKEKKA